MPLAQKYCQGCWSPSSLPLALRMARAGIMVAKMPANSAATSRMGPQAKPFSPRRPLGVVHRESAAMASMPASWNNGCKRRVPDASSTAATPPR